MNDTRAIFGLLGLGSYVAAGYLLSLTGAGFLLSTGIATLILLGSVFSRVSNKWPDNVK